VARGGTLWHFRRSYLDAEYPREIVTLEHLGGGWPLARFRDVGPGLRDQVLLIDLTKREEQLRLMIQLSADTATCLHIVATIPLEEYGTGNKR